MIHLSIEKLNIQSRKWPRASLLAPLKKSDRIPFKLVLLSQKFWYDGAFIKIGVGNRNIFNAKCISQCRICSWCHWYNNYWCNCNILRPYISQYSIWSVQKEKGNLVTPNWGTFQMIELIFGGAVNRYQVWHIHLSAKLLSCMAQSHCENWHRTWCKASNRSYSEIITK